VDDGAAGKGAMDGAVLGEAAQVEEARRPIGFVEGGDRGGPEGPLFAGGDERGAEKRLVVAPVAHEPNRQVRIAAGGFDQQQADQARAAPDLDQADVAAGGHRPQRGGDKPMLGESVGLGRLGGEPVPFRFERGHRLRRWTNGHAHGHGPGPFGRRCDPAHGSHRRAIADRGKFMVVESPSP